MLNNYDSITILATDAIEAMAAAPHEIGLCPATEVQALAAFVFFSWLQNVGRSAKRSDAQKMADLIVGML